MNDTYLALRAPAQAELKVKGSRFLAEALPVETVEAAEAEIEAVRRREHSATHHCTAYRIGPAAAIFRSHDDGEPSGTAGAPILRQIEARRLTDTLVVVTRYFGGTKLGTGGLLRAYGEAASLALNAAPVEARTIRERLRLRFAYPDTSPALHTLNRFDAEIQATHYSEQTELFVGVRRSQVTPFLGAFADALAGRGTAERVETERG